MYSLLASHQTYVCVSLQVQSASSQEEKAFLTWRSAAPEPFELECKEEACWNMCPGVSSAVSSDIKGVEYPLLLALDSTASAEPLLSATSIKY